MAKRWKPILPGLRLYAYAIGDHRPTEDVYHCLPLLTTTTIQKNMNKRCLASSNWVNSIEFIFIVRLEVWLSEMREIL
jgi:hypothetical protein